MLSLERTARLFCGKSSCVQRGKGYLMSKRLGLKLLWPCFVVASWTVLSKLWGIDAGFWFRCGRGLVLGFVV